MVCFWIVNRVMANTANTTIHSNSWGWQQYLITMPWIFWMSRKTEVDNYFIVHCLGRCCRTYFLWWHGRCLSLACDISCWCYQVSYSGTTSYFVVISSDIISLSLVPLIWRVVWKKSLTLDLLSNSFSFVQRSKKQFARRILQSIRSLFPHTPSLICW